MDLIETHTSLYFLEILALLLSLEEVTEEVWPLISNQIPRLQSLNPFNDAQNHTSGLISLSCVNQNPF